VGRKPKPRLGTEVKFLSRQVQYELWTAVATQTIKWGGLVAIAWMGYKCISSLAGRTTQARVLVNFLGDLKVSQAVSWAMTAAGFSYGRVQSRLRKTKEKILGDRIKELEEAIDQHRDSSQ
jgi:hypothetical protein